LSLIKAAELLGLSYRQTKRSYARYREQGDAGLVHRLRGRASNRGVDSSRREQVIERVRERYSDFGPTLAAEYLAKEGFVATVDESLAEQPPLTQFGRAMQELDVTLILAHSPQAKGRVERRHQVFQDRLVKALRLAQISDLDAANHFLEETFLPELNERFTREPRSSANFHRPLLRGVS